MGEIVMMGKDTKKAGANERSGGNNSAKVKHQRRLGCGGGGGHHFPITVRKVKNSINTACQ